MVFDQSSTLTTTVIDVQTSLILKDCVATDSSLFPSYSNPEVATGVLTDVKIEPESSVITMKKATM